MKHNPICSKKKLANIIKLKHKLFFCIQLVIFGFLLESCGGRGNGNANPSSPSLPPSTNQVVLPPCWLPSLSFSQSSVQLGLLMLGSGQESVVNSRYGENSNTTLPTISLNTFCQPVPHSFPLDVYSSSTSRSRENLNQKRKIGEVAQVFSTLHQTKMASKPRLTPSSQLVESQEQSLLSSEMQSPDTGRMITESFYPSNAMDASQETLNNSRKDVIRYQKPVAIKEEKEDEPINSVEMMDSQKIFINKEHSLVKQEDDISTTSSDERESNLDGNFGCLSLKLIENIFSYLFFQDLLKIRLWNKSFFNLISNVSVLDRLGIENQPQRSNFHLKLLKIDKTVSFDDLRRLNCQRGKISPNDIPNFFFYRLLHSVANLPKLYWPYLKTSQIRAITLSIHKYLSSEVDFKNLIKNLADSKVEEVQLLFENVLSNAHLIILKKQILKILILGLPEYKSPVKKLCLYRYVMLLQELGDPELLPNSSLKKLFLKEIFEDSESPKKDIDMVAFWNNLSCSPLEVFGLINYNSTYSMNRDRFNIQALSEALPKSKLKKLILNNVGLKDVDIQFLANALPNSQLEVLNVSNNLIGNVGLETMSRQLPKSQLRKLILQSNGQEIDQAMINLIKVLPFTKIQHLNLFGSRINNQMLNKLATVLPNSRIIQLILEADDNCSSAIKALFKKLPLSLVQEISLLIHGRNNRSVIKVIANSLSKTRLKKIHLYSNQFTKVHIKTLAEGLRGSAVAEVGYNSSNITFYHLVDNIIRNLENTSVQALFFNVSALTMRSVDQLIKLLNDLRLKNNQFNKVHVSKHDNLLFQFSRNKASFIPDNANVKKRLIKECPHIQWIF